MQGKPGEKRLSPSETALIADGTWVPVDRRRANPTVPSEMGQRRNLCAHRAHICLELVDSFQKNA